MDAIIVQELRNILAEIKGLREDMKATICDTPVINYVGISAQGRTYKLTGTKGEDIE